MNQYNRSNFHKNTFCVFKHLTLEEAAEIEFVHKSKSGSEYFFTNEGVYRKSNHWGRVANCRWKLASSSLEKVNNNTPQVGYANWNEFFNNDESKPLYFIFQDDLGNFDFYHKEHAFFEDEFALRNASECSKIMKELKMVQQTDDWSKYLEITDLETTRNWLIQELLTSNTNLASLKRKLLHK